MKGKIFAAAVIGMVLAPCALMAQAPAGATGKCKDGTYTTVATKKGACKGHKGIDTWMAGAAAPAAAKSAASSATTPAAPVAAASAAKTTAVAAPAAATTAAKTSAARTATAAKAAAPGGGPGMVWVNTSSKVYHCYGTKYYGTTKEGKYMTEADAKAAGAHGEKGQTCSK